MPKSIPVLVKESKEELQKLHRQSAAHLRPRLKMLMLISTGIEEMAVLCAKTGANRDTILQWKKAYNSGGTDALLSGKRGGDRRSGISTEQKHALKEKLSEPKGAFRSYNEARAWAKEELGIDKEYHAFNKYLKRNFGTRLKAGRKSHVKKQDEAVALFKKTA